MIVFLSRTTMLMTNSSVKDLNHYIYCTSDLFTVLKANVEIDNNTFGVS